MNEGRKRTRWTCPNGCAIDYVLVCGGADLSNLDPDAPNQYFRMELTGEYTDVFANGEHGVPKSSHDHADGGCCDEPQCPKCKAYCVKGDPDPYLRPQFSDIFWTPYDSHKEHIGHGFEVIGRVDPTSYDFKESGPMWNVRLDNGIVIQALPEEIVKDDVERIRRAYPGLNPLPVSSSRVFLLKTIWTDGQDLGCGLFLFGISDTITPGTEVEALRIAATEFLSSDEGMRNNETSCHGRFRWSDVGAIPDAILTKHGIRILPLPEFDDEGVVDADAIIVGDD